MGKLAKHRFLCILAMFAVILVLIPVVRVNVLGKELRKLPGAQEETLSEAQTPQPEPTAQPEQGVQAGSDLETAVFEYGYYADDHWVEDKCAFYVKTDAAGRITIDAYYPFEIDGDEKGTVAVDGQIAAEFALTGENTTIVVPGKPDAVNYVQIDASAFALAPTAQEQRSLSFVLTGLSGLAAQEEAPQPQVQDEPQSQAQPQANGYPEAGSDRETAIYEYGYYADDHWAEDKCGFYVKTGDTGKIILETYYPYEMTGNERVIIAVDGQQVMDFNLANENTVITIEGHPNKVNYVQIDSSAFAQKRSEGDERRLAFMIVSMTAE